MKLLLILTLAFNASAFAARPSFKATDVHRAIVQDQEWLNTSRPLTSEDLRGRILLLDFWTFCCINCIHIMPDLKSLEAQFGKKLTVIGVHSAKFASERDTENIRNAILRYGLEHPVVNDASFRVWESFHVQAWPTLVLINPRGEVEHVFSGEGQRDAIAEAVTNLEKKFGKNINDKPLPMSFEKDKAPPSPLSFPGKIIYVPDFDHSPILFISDSSHNRILGVRSDGEVAVEIGSKKESGLKDGDFSQARFNKPQGLLFEPGFLYVADTGNHVLRKIDWSAKKVETLAGTGSLGSERFVKDAPAGSTSLNSPWDLAFYPDSGHIAIAMAGAHQIWSYDKEKKTVSIIAGGGAESIADGSYPDNALAQTSGLSSIGNKLYFVDSETSSLRVLEDGNVKTLIGSGLFDFGFKDGKKGTALLQHDIGVAVHGDGVFVADSYNHSLRRYDFKSETLETVTGTNIRGNSDGAFDQARFNEPNGLAFDGEVAYVTDTNNNLIRKVDLVSKKVTTLNVYEKNQPSVALSENLPNLKKDGVARVRAEIPVNVHLKLDGGWHINAEAPSYLALFEGASVRASKIFERKDLEVQGVSLPPLKAGRKYRLQGTFYYCEIKEGSACKLQSHDVVLKVLPGEEIKSSLELRVSK